MEVEILMSLNFPSSRSEKDIKQYISVLTPLKNDFYTNINEAVPFSSTTPMLVSYSLRSPKEARILGMAFDYMARFIIARELNYHKRKVLDDLVAANAFRKPFLWEGHEKLLYIVKERYNNFLILAEDFIFERDIIYLSLLQMSIFLAKLESIVRGSSLPSDFESILIIENEIEQELIELCNVFYKRFVEVLIHPRAKVIYNPTFGIGSRVIGGADADIYIDGTLFDFKTTKVNGYRRADATQLIGYYVLDQIAKKCNDDSSSLLSCPIKNWHFIKPVLEK